MFITSNEHVLYWRQTLLELETTHFALEMNTLVLEMNVYETRVHTSATHTASYQQLRNRTYVELTFENGR